jgi:hypothetical protein
MRNKNNKLGSFRKNWLSSIVSDIELPAIASRVRNVLRSSKKVSMTPTDHIK